ncbi:MAG: sigma-E processing peptidase SpoIIGA [Clostridiales bacterium]|nr:sigma-E processing peptidase SpoIIGA [Clostridiales bacterium]
MYIEFVIADNLLLTYLALSAAAKLCHCKVRVWRLIVASVVGTAVAVFYPFIRSAYASIAVKLCLWVALSFIAYFGTARPIVAAVVFLGCTFALGGACYAAELCLCGGKNVSEFIARYPICLVLICGVAVYCGMRYCVRRLRVPRVRAPYEYGTEVSVFDTKMKFAAFLDTGNCVFDARSGLPVVITDIDRFTDKLNVEGAVKFAKSLPKLRTIKAKTPAGETVIYLVRPTEISVYSDRQWHKINAMVGLVGGQGKRFSDVHEMLLCPAAMTDIGR